MIKNIVLALTVVFLFGCKSDDLVDVNSILTGGTKKAWVFEEFRDAQNNIVEDETDPCEYIDYFVLYSGSGSVAGGKLFEYFGSEKCNDVDTSFGTWNLNDENSIITFVNYYGTDTFKDSYIFEFKGGQFVLQEAENGTIYYSYYSECPDCAIP